MTSRTYYLPKNRIAMMVLNRIVRKYECSIGDIHKVNDTLRVPITCKDNDVKNIEQVLRTYHMIGE
ncbi:MAG: hypothetical protein IKO36_10465 [Bacteroidaceae bacterium]|nr:hypothetical protein [Bacteroidaceae bacterium]